MTDRTPARESWEQFRTRYNRSWLALQARLLPSTAAVPAGHVASWTGAVVAWIAPPAGGGGGGGTLELDGGGPLTDYGDGSVDGGSP